MRPLLEPLLATSLIPVLVALAPAFGPASDAQSTAPAQERDQEGEKKEETEEQKDEPAAERPAPPQLMAVNKVTRLADQLLAANGGAENLAKFKSLQFVLTPTEMVAVPQEPGDTAPRTYKEEPRSPIRFQASFTGDRRLLRMDEPVIVNGREVITTKILRITAAGEEVAFQLDGKNRSLIKEMRQTVVQDLLTVASLTDTIYGLVTGQLRGTYDGTAERDGVTYETVVASFTNGQNPEIAYRIFFNPTTNLIDRWEMHDVRRKELVMIAALTGYSNHEGLQLPSTLTWTSRTGEPILRWNYTGMQVNAEIDPARFGA